MTPEQLLELARQQAEAAEVYAISWEETPVLFEANRLKSIQSRQTRGMALRVIKNGRIGFASADGEADAQRLVDAALAVAPFGTHARFQFPSATEAAPVPVYDQQTESFPTEQMVELGQGVIDRLRRHTPDLLCEGSVRRAVQTVTILNSRGGSFSYRRTVFSAFLEGTLIRGTDMLLVGDGAASCQPLVDVSPIVESIQRQLEWARETVPAPSGQLPVIFTPLGVASALMLPLTLAFSGRAVYQGASPLTGHLGEKVYDSQISIYDDATVPLRPASRAYDDEGVPTRRIALVEGGTVQNFLYDLQTAGLAGSQSTGSASRSLHSQPSISTSNVSVTPGQSSFEDILWNIEDGLVVDQLMGASQGNIQGGEFSGNVLLGYRVVQGHVVGRVKDTMVAGNIHQALNETSAVADDARWVHGALHTPSICFSRLHVSSKG